eukprot:2527431-Rhodomonas_salina.2
MCCQEGSQNEEDTAMGWGLRLDYPVAFVDPQYAGFLSERAYVAAPRSSCHVAPFVKADFAVFRCRSSQKRACGKPCWVSMPRVARRVRVVSCPEPTLGVCHRQVTRVRQCGLQHCRRSATLQSVTTSGWSRR